MASTGEVACFGADIEEAYLKAILATGGSIPHKGILLSLHGEEKHQALAESLPHLKKLASSGQNHQTELATGSGQARPLMYATSETWHFLQQHDNPATLVYQPDETGEPNVSSLLQNQAVDLAVVIVAGRLHKDFDAYYSMRRQAIDCNVPLVTKLKQLRLLLSALANKDLSMLTIKAWDEYRTADVITKLSISH